MKLSVKFSAFVLTAAMLGFAGQADAQGWVLQLGGGVSEPLSKQLYSNYSLGYNASMALGYKVGGDLVLSVVTQADSLGLKQLSDIDNGQLPYDSSHPTTKSASFDSLQVSGIAKLYLGGVAALRPYVFGGPGVAFNDYHIHTDFPGNGSSFQSDFDTLETDFFATAGLGAELDLQGGLSLFVQAQLAASLTKTGQGNIIADSAATPSDFNSDSLSYYLPITAGINYDL